MAQTGLDCLRQDEFKMLQGRHLAVLCNQASIAKDHEHILDLLRPLHEDGFLRLKAIFGPQHGLHGHTQDNMVEWEGLGDTPIPIHSLYGERRKPSEEQLGGIDTFLIDMPDIGARYYTFIWTMALCMSACEQMQVPVVVLDRPNPIGGLQVEGTVLLPEFSSFVGLHPLPLRHGMTVGEIATYFRAKFYPGLRLQVVLMREWSRSDYFDDLDLPWVMPSPNMPTLDTAIVYPGICLLEGTNLSEGRGTTRPFETFGAPWLDGRKLADRLHGLDLPGVKFRPVEFQPTFQKHAGELCRGCFIHVKDRRAFQPVITAVAILQACVQQGGDEFSWKEPPYEYEHVKRPIDILSGNAWLADAIDQQESLASIKARFLEECGLFEPTRQKNLLYAG